LRFVLPVALASCVVAYAGLPYIERLLAEWFRSDVELRAQLVMRSMEEPITALVEKGNESKLRSYLDKITADEKGSVESALANARKALEGSDASAMNAARENLMQASHKLAEVMYKASQTSPAGAEAGPSAGAPDNGAREQQKKDEVIDAEYVDVEDKK